MNKKITVKQIEQMSYPDFVGFINQWNVLPGAHTTLSKWITFSNITEKSNILEIACTTGFSSREIAYITNCRGKAFDLSEKSIKSANYNKKEYTPNIKIDYFTADAYKFATKEKFSHIIIGAALKFFDKPEKVIKKCINIIKDEGFILASPFYIKTVIPSSLIKEFKEIFGITPTTESYKDIMKNYVGLEIIYEDHNNIIEETNEELEHYCSSTIKRACKIRGITDKKLYDIMYERLLKIKKMSNKLRPYQAYTVLILRYRSKIYPNRYIELF